MISKRSDHDDLRTAKDDAAGVVISSKTNLKIQSLQTFLPIKIPFFTFFSASLVLRSGFLLTEKSLEQIKHGVDLVTVQLVNPFMN